MEAFYYIILYASVLWLPMAPMHDLETLLEEFFDGNNVVDGKTVGGGMKIVNLTSNYYRKIWVPLNEDLKNWLHGAVKLQQPYVEGQEHSSANWNPEALYALWKDTDAKNLPMGDRVINRELQVKPRGKKLQPVETKEVPSATRPSFRSGANVQETANVIELQHHSHGYNTRSKSSKRRIVSYGLAGPSSIKRQKAKSDGEEWEELSEGGDSDDDEQNA